MSIYGEGIARVSDVLDSWKDGDGLMDWAASLGFEYKKVKQHACDVGTYTHELVENSIKLGFVAAHGSSDVEAWMEMIAASATLINGIPHSMRDEVRASSHAWMDWVQDKNLVPEHLEVSMVNRGLGVGGTPDYIGLVNGDRCLLDWKTSKRISIKHKVQLAAYWLMHDEIRPDEPIKFAGVIRLDKRMGVYEDMWWQDLSREKEFFLALAKSYHLATKLKK